jgi:quercetin dioxygenase-like cupin family protein
MRTFVGFLLGATTSAVAVPLVHTLDQAPLRTAPPGTATVAELAVGEEAWLGRLTMKPGAAVPEHQDPTEEYIYVLEGSGLITIDGEVYAMKAGSTAFMPAKATVSFQNGDEPLVAIQVFAGPESAEKYAAWPLAE